MADHKVFMEVSRQVYPGDGAEWVEIRPDPDGLGMVELVQRDGKTDEILNRMSIPREMIPKVAFAMTACMTDIEDNDPNTE